MKFPKAPKTGSFRALITLLSQNSIGVSKGYALFKYSKPSEMDFWFGTFEVCYFLNDGFKYLTRL